MITPYEIYPTSKPSQVKVIRLPASARKKVVFQLTDGDGQAVDLTQELVEQGFGPPDYSPQPELTEANLRVVLRAVDRLGGVSAFEINGEAETPGKGLVSFLLTQEVTQHPGLYVAEVGIFADDWLVRSFPVRIMVESSVFARQTRRGTLTIPEVRLALSDEEVTEDSLLDDLEFSDDQIIQAAQRVVDLWNSTPPTVMPQSYSSFPWREWWLKGCLSYLYSMAAASYRRNDLGHSAGGIQIADGGKAQAYEQMSQMLRQEFMEWMRQTKVAYNMNACWGTML